jgi:hypothetical protein
LDHGRDNNKKVVSKLLLISGGVLKLAWSKRLMIHVSDAMRDALVSRLVLILDIIALMYDVKRGSYACSIRNGRTEM